MREVGWRGFDKTGNPRLSCLSSWTGTLHSFMHVFPQLEDKTKYPLDTFWGWWLPWRRAKLQMSPGCTAPLLSFSGRSHSQVLIYLFIYLAPSPTPPPGMQKFPGQGSTRATAVTMPDPQPLATWELLWCLLTGLRAGLESKTGQRAD